MKRAGTWRRLSATAIDVIVIVFPATVLAGALWNGLARQGRLDERTAKYIGVLPLVAWLVYYLLFEVFNDATLGKMVVRIAIRRADGIRAGRWTLLLRYTTKQFGFVFSLVFALSAQPVFYWLGGMMNLIIMVGCLRALSEDRVAWHDIWCHTAVYVRQRADVTGPPANPDEPIGAPPPS